MVGRTSLFALALLIPCACSKVHREPGSSVASPADDAAVRGTFEAYRRAVLEADGEAALAAIDRNTIEYYGRMLDLARRGDEPTVRGLSLIDKILVLSLRHRLPREVVLAATPESIFIRAVEEGWIGKEGVVRTELGTIRVRDATATAAVLSRGKETPLSFAFHKEAGAWKLDLTSVMSMVEAPLKRMLEGIAPTEDEAVVILLESASGTKVTEQVWKPLQTAP